MLAIFIKLLHNKPVHKLPWSCRMEPEIVDLVGLTPQQFSGGIGPCWGHDAIFWKPASVDAGTFTERWSTAWGILVPWGYQLLTWVLHAWREQLLRAHGREIKNPDFLLHSKRVYVMGQGWVYETHIIPKS